MLTGTRMSKPSPELRHAADTPLAEIELRMSMRESPLAVAVDWRRLRAEALESPCAGRPAEWPAIHFAAGARADGTYGMQATPQRRLPSPMIVLGGAYAAGPRLAELVDLAVLVEALKSVRRIITFFRPPAGILSSHAAARLRALRTCRSCSIAWPNEAGGKVGLVAAGYVVALLIASAGVALYVASTSGPDRKTYGGMYAFGDSLLFLAVFALAAAPATGAALYFLSS